MVEDSSEHDISSSGIVVQTPVDAVRNRLCEWADYYECRSNSQPASAYSVEAEVADEIYRERRPMLSINTPDPKLDLRVSDRTIELLLREKRDNFKYSPLYLERK